MDLNKKNKFYSKVAFCLALIIFCETIVPTLSMALTSGPASPEFSSFEPVSTTSMVNEFSGSFTYNIPVLEVPGANGGGYACGLSYHSGESVESEASWVGYGWSLNPGAINRSKRGFADDSKGDQIEYVNDVPANWTVSVGASAGEIEMFSQNLPVSVGASIRYNNYKGFGYTVTAGANVGIVSLGYNLSDGDGSFSVNVNPAKLLESADHEQKLNDAKKELKAAKTIAEKKKILEKIREINKDKPKGTNTINFLSNMGSKYGMHSISEDLRATSVTKYIGESFNMQVKADAEVLPAPIGVDLGFNANLSRQKNVPRTTLAAYGYMYSKDAESLPSSMMDYYVEKQSTFNKRDCFLSIPFSNADMYALSGEGLGGGFRLYNKNVATFFPNEVKSQTTIVQMGASAELGLDLGLGSNLGVGSQSLEVKRDWSDEILKPNNGNTDNYKFADAASDEPVFFRFNNDLGGSLTYTGSSSAVKANIRRDVTIPGKMVHSPIVPSDLYASLSDTIGAGNFRSGRSSYVAYHTNGEMQEPNYRRAYEKSVSTNGIVNRTLSSNGIGEFAVYNADGNRYVYGMPVYARNEVSMQYGLRGIKANDIKNNYVAYKDISNPTSQVGEISNAPYATSYLLTEITSPDYLDRTLDGPSSDDFGGYTKFTYNKVYGDNNRYGGAWYKWRIPYTGLSYNARDLTDNLDDMGSMTSGEKEVCYLEKIETKTHVAIFVTNKSTITLGNGINKITSNGSLKDRQDAGDADTDAKAAKDSLARGINKLQMLERIELYAKPIDANGVYKLIKTTHFDYDYSLCDKVPNNFGTLSTNKNGETINYFGQRGKLTLKKVWFEYEGVFNVKISPYKFDYSYPTISTSNGVPATYLSKGITNYGSNLSPILQNPNYSPFLLDRWGCVRADGQGKQDSLKTFVDQTPSLFDPAAWQLKKITLPSGGEILVQYEQNDYRYVQDRRALGMVSLRRVPGGLTPEQLVKQNKFYLNVEDDLGVKLQGDKQKLVDLIKDEFKDKKIFFKYLYALIGSSPDIGKCNSDYVDGYVDFKTAAIDPNNGFIYITLGSGNTFDGKAYELPRNVCIDYVKHEKAGKLKLADNCNAEEQGLKDGPDPIGVAQQLLTWIASGSMPASTCLDLNESLSYLRIPLLNAKKGGGVRVKRILMHDKGIETGDEALYGSEYIYTDIDGGSSGVAINEPSSGKEENALITYLKKRTDQGILNRAASGKDKEQAEGPMGEYLLPAASIGYGRVVVQNIHSGKTNTGFIVNEFYTAKDYPFDRWYNSTEVKGSAIDVTPIQEEKDLLPIPAPYFSSNTSNIWASQGFRFVINEMHGQQKSIATYGGMNTTGPPSTTMLSSKQEFSYFEPGDKIPLMVDEAGTIQYGNPGKETEIVMERKAVEDICKNGKIEIDASMGVLPPIFPVYASGSGSASYTESKLRTHITTKIIRYPAIQKSVTSYQDGIYHVNENIAFSPTTGKALLTRTTDGYDRLNLIQPNANVHDGNYYSYEIPASTQYKEMGQKASNERKVVYGIDHTKYSNPNLKMTVVKEGDDYFLSFEVPPIAPSGTTVCNAMNTFVKGDLIITQPGHIYQTDDKFGSKIKIYPALAYNAAPVIGSSGLPASSVEILRSGRTNQLNTMVGSYTTYGPKQSVQTTTFASSAEMLLRTQIATLLTAYSGGAYGTANIPFGSYTNLVRYDQGEVCNNLNDANHPFNVEVSDKTFTVKILKTPSVGYYDPVPPPPPIPNDQMATMNELANNLNKWLAGLWNWNAASNCPKKTISDKRILYDFSYTGNGSNLIHNSAFKTSEIELKSTAGIYGNKLKSVGGISFYPGSNGDQVVVKYKSGVLKYDTPQDARFYKYFFSMGALSSNGGDEAKKIFGLHYYYNNGEWGIDINKNNFLGITTDPYEHVYSGAFSTYSTPASIYNYMVQNPYNHGYFAVDAQGVLYYYVRPNANKPNGAYVFIVRLADPPAAPPAPVQKFTTATYYTHTFTKGGRFDIDPSTGQLVYFNPTNPCYSEKVNFNFCNSESTLAGVKTINKVIASSASTYSDNWQYANAGEYIPGNITGNPYEKGEKGKWRMCSSYAYNSNIVGGSKSNTTSTERNYNDAGTYSMVLFNWKNESGNDSHWTRANTITKYSPNGDIVEQNDALNIKSTDKYGYQGMLPYITAQNAEYESVYFESFENVYNYKTFEECVYSGPTNAYTDNQLAHSGKNSLVLKSEGQMQFITPVINLTDHIVNKGLSVKVWVKSSENISNPITAIGITTMFKMITVPFNKIAQTGAWTLYEAKFTPQIMTQAQETITIGIKSLSSSCWIDDFRVQPMDAQVTTFVYDNTSKRLLASFDDQHFAMFYQYNAEGKLVRKLVETERGIKTIQETQYHTPTVSR